MAVKSVDIAHSPDALHMMNAEMDMMASGGPVGAALPQRDSGFLVAAVPRGRRDAAWDCVLRCPCREFSPCRTAKLLCLNIVCDVVGLLWGSCPGRAWSVVRVLCPGVRVLSSAMFSMRHRTRQHCYCERVRVRHVIKRLMYPRR